MPVDYQTNQSISPNVEVKRVYYTGSTKLERGAVLVYESNATLAGFTKGPGVDVNLSSGSDAEVFAGILMDDSTGSTGGWINVLAPKPGEVVWARVASGTDAGDGVAMQASGTDQGFADGGAYAAGDMGVVLLDEDASDNPFASDNLAPVLFSTGIA
jgi:hypothetical protein